MQFFGMLPIIDGKCFMCDRDEKFLLAEENQEPFKFCKKHCKEWAEICIKKNRPFKVQLIK